jgi:CheY-like chemotaxis protein
MKTILLVDDNEDVLEALALTVSVSDRDCAVLTARDGMDAVEILKSFRVDLILTDINMPVMDGYHLVEYRNRHCPQVPVLVMTAETSPDAMQKLEVLGITEHVGKPFDVEAVSRLVQDMLSAPRHFPDPAQSGVACCPASRVHPQAD